MHSRNFGRSFAAWSLAGLVFTTSAFAQLGDNRPGDTPQRPPSPEIEVPLAPILSAADALRTFVLPPGFRIELVAAEPLVQDPVVVAFDPRGRMWVVEMSAYNHEILERLPVYLDAKQPKPERPPGRIVRLEDTDGDGRMDRRVVYWDQLSMPRAIAFYRDQVLVTDPPNLWLTRDRNDDGVMDEKTLLETNFGTPENFEVSPSGLLWGRDNWLYNASCTVRFRPRPDGSWERGVMPKVGHFGITQDDFGRLFYNGNSDHLRGDLVPSHYAGGIDPRLPFHGVNIQIATDQSTWPVRPTPGANRSYREGQLRDDATMRGFSAASAPLIYRGDNFPASFDGNAFVPEPAGNLVKRALIAEVDGRLLATHAYHNAEFLASSDERFRPVYLATGPDGALYVADFYRGMIEGYQFATSYLRDQILNRELNKPLWGLGRIYRIVHERGPKAPVADFALADANRSIALLTSENGWTRETAQRRIVESTVAGIVPALRQLLVQGRKPRDRVAAIWCLEGLRQFTADDASTAWSDADAHVRIAALQAAEPLPPTASAAALLARAAETLARVEPLVLAQLALSLGRSNTPEARVLLWRILERAGEHPVLADAILIALRDQKAEVLRWLQARIVEERGLTFGARGLCESLAVHLTLGDESEALALAAAIRDRGLPQVYRLALMRGATRFTNTTLPEAALTDLSVHAPDSAVRQKAESTLAACEPGRLAWQRVYPSP